MNKQVSEHQPLLDTILASAALAVYVTDKDLIIVDINKAFSDLLGYERDEMIGSHITDLFTSNANGQLTDAFAKSFTSSKHTSLEFDCKTKRGENVLICEEASIHEIDGKYYRFGFVKSCSYRTAKAKETHDQLQKSLTDRRDLEKKLQRVVNHSPDVICTIDAEGIFTWINEASNRLWGYTPKEIIGTPFTNYVHPDDANKSLKISEAVMSGQTVFDFENRYIHKDQSIVVMRWSGVWDAEEETMYCIAHDSTQLKQAERDLRMLINNTRESFVLVDRNLEIISFNEKFKKEYEHFFKREVKRSDSILDYALPERVPLLKALYQRVFEGQTEQAVFSFSFPEIGLRTIKSTFSPVFDDKDESVVAVFVSSGDVTEEVEREKELKLSKERYEYVTKATTDGIWDWDLVTDEIYWSEGFRKLFGYEFDKHKGDEDRWYNAIHHEDREWVYNSILACIEDPTCMTWEEEYRFYNKSGEVTNVFDRGVILRHPDGQAYRMIGAVQDITLQKELESLHKKASKLVRIGSWEVDLQKNSLYWSDVTHEIHGVEVGNTPSIQDAVKFFAEGHARATIETHFRRAQKTGEGWDLEVQIITLQGTEKWVRTIGEAHFEDGKCVKISGSFQDIDRLKRIDIQLKRKTELLSAISGVNKLLLNYYDWFDVMEEAFIVMSRAISVDRIYYFEYFEKGNYLTQRVEWCREGITPQVDNEELQYVPIDSLADFMPDMISNGIHSAITSNLEPGSLRELLEQQNILSALMVPLSIDGKLAGFIGVDDCTTERRWTTSETEFIQTISSNLSSAYEKYTAQNNIINLLAERNNILERIDDAFFAVSKDWTVIYWNRQAELALEMARDKIIGKKLWDIYENAIGSESYIEYHKAIEYNETRHFETYYPPLNKWFEISAFPGDDGLSVYFKNVTERIQNRLVLQASNERFELVSDATDDAIWDWDLITEKIYWGSGFHKLFGFDGNEIATNIDTWSKLCHPEDRQAVMESLKLTIKDKSVTKWNEEYRFQRADGSYAFVNDRGAVIRDENGKAIRFVGAMQDITPRKEYEESLLELNTQLAEQTMQLEASNKELEQFAYVASHDLQEPLRMVTSFLSQIDKRYTDLLDDKGKQYIGYAIDGARRMRQIILDLLNYSRMGRFDEDSQRIDLNELLKEVIYLNNTRITETQATIELDELPILSTYKTPLLQIFHNLISNALKYKKPDTNPVIYVRYTRLINGVQFTVEDNGIGISADYYERIFGIFQRLHNQKEFSGTGVGLSIVKKIVENLRGKVEVESEEGIGTKFHIFLPEDVLPPQTN